jgi:hypothetical protein
MFKKFWDWYESHYHLNVGITAGLFLLQIVHLVWLLLEVIWFKAFGYSLVHFYDLPRSILIFVDYTEIPAIISVSIIYIDALRHKITFKSILYLIFLNSQWLHLFWITDEFVIDAFSPNSVVSLPAWLAWVAILIDYLEIPVIYDVLKRFYKSKDVAVFLEKD